MPDTDYRMSLRMPRDMYEQIAALAEKADRSLTAQVLRLLRQALQNPQ